MVVLKLLTNLMAILNLVFIRKLFNLIQMVNLVLRNKVLGSINVFKTTDIISMINQTKKVTFSNNLVKKAINNFCASIVYKA